MNCLLCNTILVKNNYHRAIDSGAILYCKKCDIHLNNELRAVYIKCTCGCGYDDYTEADLFNKKLEGTLKNGGGLTRF